MSAAFVATLMVRFSGAPATGADTALDGYLRQRLASRTGLLYASTALGSPAAVVAVSGGLAIVCARWGWRRGAVLAIVAPTASAAIAEWLLKPLTDRTLDGRLTFPSGTSTGAWALAITAGVLLAAPRTRATLAAPLRVTLAAAAAAGAATVTVAVVALRWHYATDAVGGAATAATVVVGVAFAIDGAAALRRRLLARPSPARPG